MHMICALAELVLMIQKVWHMELEPDAKVYYLLVYLHCRKCLGTLVYKQTDRLTVAWSFKQTEKSNVQGFKLT